MSGTCRSTGAGQISTVTLALCGCTSRTDESTTPTVTPSRTRDFASFTDTVSVVAVATKRTRDSRPTMSTVGGPAIARPTTNPGAGSPSVTGTSGTLRGADFSSSSASVG